MLAWTDPFETEMRSKRSAALFPPHGPFPVHWLICQQHHAQLETDVSGASWCHGARQLLGVCLRSPLAHFGVGEITRPLRLRSRVPWVLEGGKAWTMKHRGLTRAAELGGEDLPFSGTWGTRR